MTLKGLISFLPKIEAINQNSRKFYQAGFLEIIFLETPMYFCPTLPKIYIFARTNALFMKTALKFCLQASFLGMLTYRPCHDKCL